MEKNKKRDITIISIGIMAVLVFLITSIFSFGGSSNNSGNPDNMAEFSECLSDKGVTIYATKTCPSCSSLVESLGGYDAVEPIYVECMENQERCDEEKDTEYVPEIQINGELYEGQRSKEKLSEVTNCSLP